MELISSFKFEHTYILFYKIIQINLEGSIIKFPLKRNQVREVLPLKESFVMRF